MPVRLLLLTVFLLPTSARADCLGFFNKSEQGYKLEGKRLEPSGPTVASGTQFEFNGITQIRDRFFLTRSRSELIFDAQNVELTGGCDLPTRPPPEAR